MEEPKSNVLAAAEASDTDAEKRPEEGGPDFPVVGVGASAGGIQALLKMLERIPPEPGFAIVVVLHLSVGVPSEAAAVLQRGTDMQVTQVTETVPIEPNKVYVIPPGHDLVMEDGHLVLHQPEQASNRPVAIDVFFRTLAVAHKERAIAVVLSGAGTDGAVGISRVKEYGGVIIAQRPSDADHDNMPLAAIASATVDFILPAVEIGTKLLELRDNMRAIRLPPVDESESMAPASAKPDLTREAEDALQSILLRLRASTGHDFRCYKRATILRRLERRLQVRGAPDLPAYRSLLEEHPDEHQLLLKDLLIGVTNFFRDSDVFRTLETEILAEMTNAKRGDEPLRIWVAACSTGEEAYSLAMLLADKTSQMANPPAYQIFASDIDESAIAMARGGLYPASIAEDIPASYLRQYFQKEGDRYRIRKLIRDRVLFASHNLLSDPPFSRLDMISCRNLLIYLNREIQMHLLETFHFSLNPGGVLLLGSSESADATANLFSVVDKKHRIYRAKSLARSARYAPSLPGGRPGRPIDAAVTPRPNKRDRSFAEVHQKVLAQHAPPSVIVNHESEILHMTDRAGRFLRHVGGEPTRNIVSLVQPELRLELRTALFQAVQSGKSVEARKVQVQRDERRYFVSMSVRPFRDEDAGADLVLILFDEFEQTMSDAVDQGDEGKSSVMMQLEEELQRTKGQLQETVEHSEVSNEELRASNEELQAINEELRSATEELETSKEELQSVNEELVTVNFELKAKVEETGKVNDDLKNLIASTDIATIFVDRGMRIKRYTPRAADLFNIIPSDLGRSLMDITHRLEYPQLAEDAASTFETLRPVEREVRSSDGRYYIVRQLPYRTTEDRIEGAVMTFFDISSRREAEEQLRAQEDRLRLVVECMDDFGIITLDPQRRVTSWSKGAERLFGFSEQEILGQSGDLIFTPEDRDAGAPEQEATQALHNGRAEDERWHMRRDGSLLYGSGVTTPLPANGVKGFAKIVRDQTQRVRMEQQREAQLSSEQAGRSVAEQASAMKDEFLAVLAHELRQPLNLIHMSSELLARLPEMKESKLGIRSAQSIRDAVATQAKVINDLLDMSRLNTGKLALSVSDLDLGAVVHTACEALRADPGLGDRTVLFELPTESIVVRADKVRIEQVLHNLLGNAVKFTPPGGQISVSLAMDNQQVRLEVSDNGSGIPTDLLPHVFDMFMQVSRGNSRGAEGLGIGLSLVRQIVELHGGAVRAESDGVGTGSRFIVSIPLPRSGSTAVHRPAQAPNIAGVSILLVEDMPESAAAFRELLELEGAKVEVAGNANKALEVLDEKTFDLVISDISMPRMDGYAFVRELRKRQADTAPPAIAITGLGRAEDSSLAYESGFAAHMVKPVSIDDLLGVVSRLLGSRAD